MPTTYMNCHKYGAILYENGMMANPDSITISKDQVSIFMVVYLGQGNEAIYRYALQDAKDDELFIRAEEILQHTKALHLWQSLFDFFAQGQVDSHPF